MDIGLGLLLFGSALVHPGLGLLLIGSLMLFDDYNDYTERRGAYARSSEN